MKKSISWLAFFSTGLLLSLILSLRHSPVTAQSRCVTEAEAAQIVALVKEDILSRAPEIENILVVDSDTIVCDRGYVLISWHENAGGLYSLQRTTQGWQTTGAFGGVPYASDLVEVAGIPPEVAERLVELWYENY